MYVCPQKLQNRYVHLLYTDITNENIKYSIDYRFIMYVFFNSPIIVYQLPDRLPR